MKAIVRYITCAFLAVVVSAPSLYAQSSNLKWEAVKAMTNNMKHIAKENDIEVFSAPSLVFINVNRNVKVQIFTILGKLVSSQNLEPGSYEFKLETHGVYIIKTPETTCKVAI